MTRKEAATKVGAIIWPVMLLALGVFATIRVSAAVEASNQSAENSERNTLYAQVALCDNEYESLTSKIAANEQAALTDALQQLPLEPGDTRIDPRQVFLDQANELAAARRAVATVRFETAVDTSKRVQDGTFDSFDCPEPTQSALDAANDAA